MDAVDLAAAGLHRPALSDIPVPVGAKPFPKATCAPDDGSDEGPWFTRIVAAPAHQTGAELRASLAAAEREGL